MRLIIGKVKSGKTAFILREIKQRVQTGTGKALLLVPEQYSHEAERELCEACGDRMSLYAEVMSFSSLARWSRGQYGKNARIRMDEGGKLLCMMLAVRDLQPILKHYGLAADNPDLISMILRELAVFEAAAAENSVLEALSLKIGGMLGEKLKELALIREAFRTHVELAGCIAEDPLSILAQQLEQYGLGEFDSVYVDGFVDFTGQEQAVLKAILKTGCNLTICFTGENKERAEEYYLLSRAAIDKLTEYAEENEIPVETIMMVNEGQMEKPDKAALRYYCDHMFDFLAETWPEKQNSVRLIAAKNPREECEAAAAAILESVRRDGCRWRDIAVAVRGFEEYRVILESIFQRYEIPLYLSERTPLTEKPLPLWIETAYEIVLGNWNPEAVATMLQCGLSRLNAESRDLLCSYLNRWQIHGRAWQRRERWNQHPQGYGKPYTGETEEILNRLDRIRREFSAPLLDFGREIREADNAELQAAALIKLLQRCDIPKCLMERAGQLQAVGKNQLSSEYSQVWEICMNAIEQLKTVMGETPMDAESFRSLLRAVFASYDIGTIPTALDRVSVGDFDRMRRRNIRRLFVLGCTDERLPSVRERNGLFTQEERNTLSDFALSVGGGEAELWREYSLILHTLSLPHEQLILLFSSTGLQGETCLPASVYTRAQAMFDLRPESASVFRARMTAREPLLSLAAASLQPNANEEMRTAHAFFQEHDPQRLETITLAAQRKSDRLSEHAVRALYGNRLKLSPSKLESFAECRFQYYCSYGLKAEPEKPAEFKASEIGSFIHWTLEKAAQRVYELGGFQAVTDEKLHEIVSELIAEFIHTELNDFEEKSARFRHLFERLAADVYRIAEDTAAELRKSSFQPLSFELDISQLKNTELHDRIQLTGIADRVDGWAEDGQLYLRIVDYKTGRKKFSMSDVWYCRNLQMLLYLFAVCDNAPELYGINGSPAGMIYLPAREEVLNFDRKPDAMEKEKLRMRGKRRSGLVLADPDVISAWEHGESTIYLPEKTRTSNPQISAEQMEMLRGYVTGKVEEMAEEIRSGEIEPNPEYASETSNACLYCPYRKLCRIEDGDRGIRRSTPQLSDESVWQNMEEAVEVQRTSFRIPQESSDYQEGLTT